MAVTLADDDLGTDVELGTDLGLRWPLASGRRNLVLALLRRLSTDAGSLFYAPAYGYNLRGRLHDDVTPAGIAAMRQGITEQCELDPRVESCTCAVAFTFATGTLRVDLRLEDADGPFDLVLLVTDEGLTVDLLNAGAAPLPEAGEPAGEMVIRGEQGVPGPAGAPGTAGGGGAAGISLDYAGAFGDSTGVEVVVRQWTGDMSAVGASPTADIDFRALSASGTATVRLRVGGTFDAADGTVVGSVSVTGASFAVYEIQAGFTNPTGVVPIKLTIQSSGAGVDAQGADVIGSIA